MGNKTLIYKIKVKENLEKSYIHLKRLKSALNELSKYHSFPIDSKSYEEIINNKEHLAFCDQVI